MLSLSYTKSVELESLLKSIDTYRKIILLTPIPLRKHMSTQYEAKKKKVYSLSQLEGIKITKDELDSLSSATSLSKKDLHISHVYRYKKTFEELYSQWYGNDKKVDHKSIIDILSEFTNKKPKKIRSIIESQKKVIEYILEYSQSFGEHPIVEYGLIYLSIYDLGLVSEAKIMFASLIGDIFLFKKGYDCHQLYEMESYYLEHRHEFLQLINDKNTTNRLTRWISFCAKAHECQLKEIGHAIQNTSYNNLTEKENQLTKLNRRQKMILEIFANPDNRITNRQVQKMCQVSQITASRDLSRLAMLGLLFTHGKGRSIYYTRA